MMFDTTCEAVDSDVEAARDACLRGLGIDPATVVWPAEYRTVPDDERSDVPAAAALSEEDWQAIAPLLPAEAAQASTMRNKDFLQAVLVAMQRGGRWTSRASPTAAIEPVRRRFGRWAHLGVFQNLAAASAGLDLTPETTRLLRFAGQRAASLQARATDPDR